MREVLLRDSQQGRGSDMYHNWECSLQSGVAGRERTRLPPHGMARLGAGMVGKVRVGAHKGAAGCR